MSDSIQIYRGGAAPRGATVPLDEPIEGRSLRGVLAAAPGDARIQIALADGRLATLERAELERRAGSSDPRAIERAAREELRSYQIDPRAIVGVAALDRVVTRDEAREAREAAAAAARAEREIRANARAEERIRAELERRAEAERERAAREAAAREPARPPELSRGDFAMIYRDGIAASRNEQALPAFPKGFTVESSTAGVIDRWRQTPGANLFDVRIQIDLRDGRVAMIRGSELIAAAGGSRDRGDLHRALVEELRGMGIKGRDVIRALIVDHYGYL